MTEQISKANRPVFIGLLFYCWLNSSSCKSFICWMLIYKRGRAVLCTCPLSRFMILNSLRPQIHKPGGDSSLDRYGSSAAVSNVIVFGPWKKGGQDSPLCAWGCRWCHTQGAGDWERARQQLWNAGSSRRTQSYPHRTPLWGWSTSLGREEQGQSMSFGPVAHWNVLQSDCHSLRIKPAHSWRVTHRDAHRFMEKAT